jgi:hypothetical protein
MGDAQIYDSMLRDGLNDAFSGEHSGWHTEDLVKSRQITRGTGPLGRAIAKTLFGRAGGGQIQGRDHTGRTEKPQRAEGFRQG